MGVNGNQIVIGTVSGHTFTAIAAVKSQDIQVQCDTIEKSSASQQKWKEILPGRISWSVATNYLVLNDVNCNVEDVLTVGTEVLLKIKGRDGTYAVQGSAYVTTCRQSFQRGNLSVGSWQFTGNGQLSAI